MQTANSVSTKIQWRFLALLLLLISILLLGLSACGKKGPLYHAPAEEQSEKK